MANPQPADQHLRIASSIQEEIMMRDFSKRQRSILDLILRLSWGCGKKTAIIPKQKDFEIVGIGETNVKKELSWLENAKVIVRNNSTGEFKFNKDYDAWRVSIVHGFDRERFAALLHLNLDTYQNNNDSYQNDKPGDDELIETIRKNLLKQEVEQSADVDGEPTCGQSITSIITSKDIYTAEFEKFYAEYPRPEDKRRSFNNWKTCRKQYTADQLMTATQNYAKAKIGTERQYLKTSANFLGREKFFEDYLNKEPQEAPKPLEPEYTPEDLEFIERMK